MRYGKGLGGVLILVLMLATGCSHVHHPVALEKFTMDIGSAASKDLSQKQLVKAAVFDGPCSVEFVNQQDDASERLIMKLAGHKHFVNYREWTQFFVDEWSQELEKRGCSVGAGSPNRIGVRLSDFRLEPGMWVATHSISVDLVSLSGNWTLTYPGYAHRPGVDFSAAVYQTIAQLLQDPGVRARLAGGPAGGTPADGTGPGATTQSERSGK